ncbi:MAG: glycosyltransferase family 39 protein [Microscillaceae bacterium]|nr:glycosyltransferase family 39 protein [Microscillaceae bacterium]
MKNTNYWLLGILLVSYLVISANIGGLDVYALDEARNATCAREMMKKGEWIVPTFNGQLRVEKPPLHYYFMMLGYAIFGFGEFGARFFSVIFGLLTIGVTFLFAKRYLDLKTAVFSALSLTASIHYSIQFHMAVPDPYLIFFIAAGMFAFYRGFTEKQPIFLYLAYASLALGYMCKGPIALLLPGMSIFFYLIFSRSFTWKNILKARPFEGLLIAIMVIAPWHIAVGQATQGEWLRGFYYQHNVYRFTNTMEGHGGIFLLTWVFVLIGLLPLVVYLPQALGKAWKDRGLHQHALLFCLMASGSIVLFFSISKTKLPNYTVPSYPFFAVLLGYYLAHFEWTNRSYRGLQVSSAVYLLLMLALAIGAYIGIQFDEALSDLKNVAYYFVLLPIGGVIALYFVFRKEFEKIVYTQILSFIWTTLLFFWFAFPQIDRRNPLHVAIPKMNLSKPIIAHTAFNPAFVFYADKVIPMYGDYASMRAAIDQYEEVYIIIRKDRLEEFAQDKDLEIVVMQRDIFELPTTVVLKKVKHAEKP